MMDWVDAMDTAMLACWPDTVASLLLPFWSFLNKSDKNPKGSRWALKTLFNVYSSLILLWFVGNGCADNSPLTKPLKLTNRNYENSYIALGR